MVASPEHGILRWIHIVPGRKPVLAAHKMASLDDDSSFDEDDGSLSSDSTLEKVVSQRRAATRAKQVSWSGSVTSNNGKNRSSRSKPVRPVKPSEALQWELIQAIEQKFGNLENLPNRGLEQICDSNPGLYGVAASDTRRGIQREVFNWTRSPKKFGRTRQALQETMSTLSQLTRAAQGIPHRTPPRAAAQAEVGSDDEAEAPTPGTLIHVCTISNNLLRSLISTAFVLV
jgi:hypothetical protein